MQASESPDDYHQPPVLPVEEVCLHQRRKLYFGEYAFPGGAKSQPTLEAQIRALNFEARFFGEQLSDSYWVLTPTLEPYTAPIEDDLEYQLDDTDYHDGSGFHGILIQNQATFEHQPPWANLCQVSDSAGREVCEISARFFSEPPLESAEQQVITINKDCFRSWGSPDRKPGPVHPNLYARWKFPSRMVSIDEKFRATHREVWGLLIDNQGGQQVVLDVFNQIRQQEIGVDLGLDLSQGKVFSNGCLRLPVPDRTLVEVLKHPRAFSLIQQIAGLVDQSTAWGKNHIPHIRRCAVVGYIKDQRYDPEVNAFVGAAATTPPDYLHVGGPDEMNGVCQQRVDKVLHKPEVTQAYQWVGGRLVEIMGGHAAQTQPELDSYEDLHDIHPAPQPLHLEAAS
jgi:hypothetical protein